MPIVYAAIAPFIPTNMLIIVRYFPVFPKCMFASPASWWCPFVLSTTSPSIRFMRSIISPRLIMYAVVTQNPATAAVYGIPSTPAPIIVPTSVAVFSSKGILMCRKPFALKPLALAVVLDVKY